MIRKAKIRPAAHLEIDHQADYLAEHAGEAVARRFLESISDTIQLLIEAPGANASWISDNARLQGIRKRRVIGFPNHLLFYLHDEKSVEIIHLYHAKQDIGTNLADELDDTK